MPIGDKVRRALAAQENRTCVVCKVAIPGRRTQHCGSKSCQDALWQQTKGYEKNKRDQRNRIRQKRAQTQQVIDRGMAALERERMKKPDALTLAIATKSPLPNSVSSTPLQQSDIAPPSSKEMRSYIHARYGADAQRLLDRLEAIAFYSKGVQPKVIVDAVKELLDRGWGKTTQSIAVAAVAPVFALPDESKGDALLPDLGNDDPDQPDVIEAEATSVNEGDTE